MNIMILYLFSSFNSYIGLGYCGYFAVKGVNDSICLHFGIQNTWLL